MDHPRARTRPWRRPPAPRVGAWVSPFATSPSVPRTRPASMGLGLAEIIASLRGARRRIRGRRRPGAWGHGDGEVVETRLPYSPRHRCGPTTTKAPPSEVED